MHGRSGRNMDKRNVCASLVRECFEGRNPRFLILSEKNQAEEKKRKVVEKWIERLRYC